MAVAIPSSILTGPFKSKLYGATLTLDLGSHEVALAVSRTNSMPRASVVVTTAAREIMRLSKGGEKVHAIVLVGSQYDPTAHPSFLEITENVRDLRNKWFPKAKLVLLTDDPQLEEYRVRHALGIYDQPTFRFEWGTVKTYTAMTGRKGPELTSMVKHLTSLEKVVIRTTFQRGKNDNSTPSEFKGWLKRVEEIKPTEVQVSNLLTPVEGQKAITATRMKQIVEALGGQSDFPVTVLEDRDEPLE
jgi:hypothetical protein